MKIHLGGLLLLAMAGNSFGSLIFDGPTNLGGTGLGNVETVLTLQSPGNTSDESGCVAPGPTTAGCGFTDVGVKTGNAQIGTPSLDLLGITSASQIGIVLNAGEPSGDGITVNALTLTLYGPNGVLGMFTAALQDLPTTQPGVGNSGFLWRLDTAQAASADALISGAGGPSNVNIGLGSSLSNATGGLDTYFVAPLQASEAPGVPEPPTLMLLGSGLTGFGLLASRRKTRRN